MNAARQYENYYEYDPAGNRTLLRHGETGAENLTYYDYNAANELTQLHDADGWTYFEFDANGNTVIQQTPGYTRYFDWDGRDMLVAVRSTEGGWTDNEYRYDGLAARAAAVDSGGMSYFSWDDPESRWKLTAHPVFQTDLPIDLLCRRDSAMSVTRRHVPGWGFMIQDDTVAMVETAAGAIVPVQDEMSTVWKTLDGAAAVDDSASYDAFGDVRSSSGLLSQWGFGAKERAADTGLLSFPARAYGPARGLFLSRDPEGAGKLGPYYGMQQRPTVYSDPYGLDAYKFVQECIDRPDLRRLWQMALRQPPGPARRVLMQDYAEALRACVEKETPWGWKARRSLEQFCGGVVKTTESDTFNCLCGLTFLADIVVPSWSVPGLVAEYADCGMCEVMNVVRTACRKGLARGVLSAMLTAVDCLGPTFAKAGCAIGSGVGSAFGGPPVGLLGCLFGGYVTEMVTESLIAGAQMWIRDEVPGPNYPFDACCRMLDL